MEALPHDILAQIFLYLPLTLEDKLSISSVSRGLRRAALDMPLLWSAIEVSGERGLPWLVLMLARSRDAPLDVVLCPQGREFGYLGNEEQRPDLSVVVAALLPHVASLRSLCIYLYDLQALIPLLDAYLSFDRLVQLVVHGGTDALRLFRISAATPQLEVLDLRLACARNWGSVLTPSLTALTLDLAAVTADFMDVLVQCCSNTLRDLAFTDCERGRGAIPFQGYWVLSGLTSLGLFFFESARALELLQVMPIAHVPYVFVSLSNNIDAELLDTTGPSPLISFLVHGAGEIVEFEIHRMGEFTVIFDNGKCYLNFVEARPLAPVPSAAWGWNLWTCLCHHFGAQRTVRTCELGWRDWDGYLALFTDRPPLAPRFLLRVYTDYHPTYSGAMKFPTLAKVVLTGGIRLGLTGLKGFLMGLVEDALECSSSSEVELCICDAVSSERLSVSDTRAALEEWIRRKTDGPWATTRWFLCPGHCD